MKPRTRFLSSGVISISRSGRSVSRCALARIEQVMFALDLRRLHLLQVFLHALQALLDLAQIVDDEVEVDVLDVAQRIDGADVRDGVVFEGADDVGQRVDVAEVGREGGLVQRFFARARRRRRTRRWRGSSFLRVVKRGQAVETVVGNLGDAEMRLARIAAALRHLLPGQHNEERSFAYLRQAYDAGFHKVAISS